jgi:tetratricopeptide (TPR) repeat protein
MASKVSGILSKVLQDRRRGDYEKALKRLTDGIEKISGEVLLHREAIDVALEAGESMRAAIFFKSAQREIPDSFEELWAFGKEKVEAFNDPIFCKYMLDVAIKTAGELLKRTRTKKQALRTANNQAFKGEMTVNTLAEAMLCVRSKRFQDAARTFVQILDDKPVEHKVLTPYLTVLQKQHPKKGGLSYALGCSCLLSEKYAKGISMIVQGAALAPTNAEDAVKRVEALRDVHDAPSDHVELALAKLLIIKGDDHRAAEHLDTLLGQDHARATPIIQLLEPHVEEIGDNLVLNYLYIETALLAGSNARALVQIKSIYAEARHRNDLLAWLDLKSQESFMTVEILARYGEMALEQQMFQKAIEIFRELLSQAPHEVHYIKELVGGYLKDSSVKEFYDEITDSRPAEASQDDGFSIEHYGSRDFSLDGHLQQTAVPPPVQPEPPPSEARAAVDETPDSETIDANDDTSDDISDDTSDDTGSSYENKNDSEFEKEHTLDVGDRSAAKEARVERAQAATPAASRTEQPPAETASETENIDDDIDVPDVILLGSSDVMDDAVSDEPAQTPQSPPAPPSVPDDPDNFETRYRAFENGDLDNNEIIDLVEKAAKQGKMGEMKNLLAFKPKNVAQEVKRKYYLAEYYLHEDQPLSALVILKTVNLNALSKDERKAFLLKNAYCYQQLNRFDAAHSAYLKIMSEDPNFSAAEHMAKVNYEKHLQSSASGGPVLEKVSTLHKTGKEEEEQ